MNILRQIFSRTSTESNREPQSSTESFQGHPVTTNEKTSKSGLANSSTSAPDTSSFKSIWNRNMQQAEITNSSKFIAAFKAIGEKLGLFTSTDISDKTSADSKKLIAEGRLKDPKLVLKDIKGFTLSSSEVYEKDGNSQFARGEDKKRFSNILREIEECPIENQKSLVNEAKSHIASISWPWGASSTFKYEVTALKEDITATIQFRLDYLDVNDFKSDDLSDPRKYETLKGKLENVLSNMKQSRSFKTEEIKNFIKGFLVNVDNYYKQNKDLVSETDIDTKVKELTKIIKNHQPLELAKYIEDLVEEHKLSFWS